MKRIVIGYIFSGRKPGKDEEIFLRLAKEKGIKLILFNIFKNIDEKKIEKMAKKCKIFFNSTAEDFAIECAKTIEELGKKVIDSPRAYYYEEDKWMFFLKCKEYSIPTPETILLSENLNIARKEIHEFNRWPIILKRVIGTMGEYVEKADNVEQAVHIIEKFWRKGNEKLPIIAQEFIKSPSYRVTLIGKKIVQTALKENKSSWKATGVYAKNFKKFEVDKKLMEMVKKIMKFAKIHICGIDFLKKGDKWMALEVNSQPAFDFFEDEREKLINQTLEHLKKIAEKNNISKKAKK